MMEDSQHPHSTVTMPEISLAPVAGPSTGMCIFNTGHHSQSFDFNFPSPLPPSPLIFSPTLGFLHDANSGRLTPTSSLAPSNSISVNSQSSGPNLSCRPSQRGLGNALPFSWVNNPKWAAFVDEFIPAAVSPSWKTLSRRIIPNLVKELRDQVKNEVYGQNATIQADGWTGENHHHLIAFMITVNDKTSTR